MDNYNICFRGEMIEILTLYPFLSRTMLTGRHWHYCFLMLYLDGISVCRMF